MVVYLCVALLACLRASVVRGLCGACLLGFLFARQRAQAADEENQIPRV